MSRLSRFGDVPPQAVINGGTAPFPAGAWDRARGLALEAALSRSADAAAGFGPREGGAGAHTGIGLKALFDPDAQGRAGSAMERVGSPVAPSRFADLIQQLGVEDVDRRLAAVLLSAADEIGRDGAALEDAIGRAAADPNLVGTPAFDDRYLAVANDLGEIGILHVHCAEDPTAPSGLCAEIDLYDLTTERSDAPRSPIDGGSSSYMGPLDAVRSGIDWMGSELGGRVAAVPITRDLFEQAVGRRPCDPELTAAAIIDSMPLGFGPADVGSLAPAGARAWSAGPGIEEIVGPAEEGSAARYPAVEIAAAGHGAL